MPLQKSRGQSGLPRFGGSTAPLEMSIVSLTYAGNTVHNGSSPEFQYDPAQSFVVQRAFNNAAVQPRSDLSRSSHEMSNLDQLFCGAWAIMNAGDEKTVSLFQVL